MQTEHEIQQHLEAAAINMWQVTPATLASHLSGGQWVPAKHLQYISQIVASAIYNGFTYHNEERIIISVPPRHGKSQLFSVWGPVWILKHWPAANVILSSYGADLATDFSRASRDLIIEHEETLGLYLKADTRQVVRWMTEQKGGEFAVGVGGPITGRGANVFLVDDYIKNAQEAASQGIRDGIWNWFNSTAYTRLQPGAPMIIVATRWHPDDLVGRLLAKSGTPWKEIKLPALAEEGDPLGRELGEALWPEQYSRAALLRIKEAIGPYYWSALYQQKPISTRAGLFSTENVEMVDIYPPLTEMIVLRSWDTAATQTSDVATDPDWTVGAKLAWHPIFKKTFLLDIVRKRLSPYGVEKLQKDTASDDEDRTYIREEIEPGSAGKSSIALKARHVLDGYMYQGVPATGAKEVRAQHFLAGLENQSIAVLRAPWNRELFEEIDAFPDGPHDDQVDACSLGYNELRQLRRHGVTWGRKVVKNASNTRRVKGATFGRRR